MANLLFTGCLSLALLLSAAADAHTGVELTNRFMDGLTHPVTGIDHLLLALLVGVWAYRRGISISGRILANTFTSAAVLTAVIVLSGWQPPYAYILGMVLSTISLMGCGAILGHLFRTRHHRPEY